MFLSKATTLPLFVAAFSILGSLCCAGKIAGQPILPPSFFPAEQRDPLEAFLRATEIAPIDAAKIEELGPRMTEFIAQLGSDRFDVREAAETKLLGLGNLAQAKLQQAAKHDDPEVAIRARRLLARLPKLTHVVTDAVGAPMPHATVTLRLIPQGDGVKAIDQTVTVVSVADGHIPIPSFPTTQYAMMAHIQHAEYGTAQCKVNDRLPRLQIPLVRRGTELHRRAIQGTVVGHDGLPVPAAVVQCRNVRTPGEGLINGTHPRGDALTDDKGRFVYYLANENRNRERGEMVPANSRYHLSISVPDDESFFPIEGMYSNAEPARITLPLASRFHRFRFERAGGGFVDEPRQLRQINVQLDGKQNGERMLVPLPWETSAKGRRLIAGTYRARGYIDGKDFSYLPLVVTAESPEELTFELPPAATYHGRVIHGVTGEPMAKAFVMAWSSTSHNNLAVLTSDDWKQLQETPDNPAMDHPTIKLLRRHYGVMALSRSDAEGRFEIVRQPDQEFYGLMAFDEDYIPLKKRTYYMKPDEPNEFPAGDFPLYPAAKVIVRPVFEGPRLSVSPKWLPSKVQQPKWIEQFHKTADDSKQEFEFVHWMKLNELQSIYVPAEVNLRLRFDTPYDDAWAPLVLDKAIQLGHREIREIGDVHFTAALPAVVRVLNKDGKPVEGVPVRRMHNDERAWTVVHNTDKEGRAFFHVNPQSQGQFRILDIRGPEEITRAKSLSVSFAVDKGPPESAYEITITDQQLKLLQAMKR